MPLKAKLGKQALALQHTHRNHFFSFVPTELSFKAKIKFRQASNPYKIVLEAA